MNDRDNERSVQLDYKETDIVEVINPTTEDFYYTVGNTKSVSNGISREQSHTVDEYVVKAGETVKLEGFKADLYIKKMVDKMLQDDNKTLSLNVNEIRKPYEEKVYIGKLNADVLTPSDNKKINQIMEESVRENSFKSGSGDLPATAVQQGETELEAFPDVPSTPKVNTAKKK